MTKFLATCAAVAMTAAFAMPAPVSAAEKRADGLRTATEQTDVSAQRRRGHRHAHGHYRHRHVHRHYGPRYGYRGYGYRPYYYDSPYYAYAPRYRYYGGPSVGVGVGPLGFGFRAW